MRWNRFRCWYRGGIVVIRLFGFSSVLCFWWILRFRYGIWFRFVWIVEMLWLIRRWNKWCILIWIVQSWSKYNWKKFFRCIQKFFLNLKSLNSINMFTKENLRISICCRHHIHSTWTSWIMWSGSHSRIIRINIMVGILLILIIYWMKRMCMLIHRSRWWQKRNTIRREFWRLAKQKKKF